MPRKRTAEEAAVTPSADSGYGSPPQGDAAPTTPAAPAKKRCRPTPKKVVKPATNYHDMPTNLGDAAPLTVSSQTGNDFAAMNSDTGEFEMVVKFHGPKSFQYITTTSYEDDGTLHFIVKPAKAFPLLKLPENVLDKVLKMVLEPEGIKGAKIMINTTTKGIKSKNFAEGLAHRVGIMSVNKQLYEACVPMIYSEHIKFDDTKTVANFMLKYPDVTKNHLRFVEITSYKKDTGPMALSALAQCRKLGRVHLSTNVAMNATPSKAAKGFYSDNSHYFQTVATKMDAVESMNLPERSFDKFRGIDVLRFGSSAKCFSVKEGEDTRAWTKEEKVEFGRILREQIK